MWLEFYYILAIPLILGLAYVAIFHSRFLLYIAAFLTPFSLNLEELGLGGIAFYFPTEPLLLAMTIMLLIGQLHSSPLKSAVLQHPVSKVLVLLLLWTGITALTSTAPLVSVKFLIAKMWFVVPCYFFAAGLFIQRDRSLIFIGSFVLGLLLVVLYTTIKHYMRGFDEESAHWIMEPFFRDHTQYAAVIAIFIPLLFGAGLEKKLAPFARLICMGGLLVLLIALVYTYSRAAWLSVVLAFGIWMAVRLKISTRIIAGMAMTVLLMVAISFEGLVMQLRQNQTDSSDDLIENVESITNISTDASNLERLNRWNAVFAMAKERPFLGFGPGTYMFEYAPYQRAQDLTVISTSFGDVGNAHSEFLGPLADMGLPGMLLTICWVAIFFRSAFCTYHRLPAGEAKRLLLYCTMGLVTYFVHGLLNNFLDADKASVPVFGLMAVVVAIDIASRRPKTNTGHEPL
ncbi:MAG: O-antigen ligase family protein [Saprospiraceae bacterium]|nr:O-antigen ligase family protein [Saprospiraceae bacterium]